MLLQPSIDHRQSSIARRQSSSESSTVNRPSSFAHQHSPIVNRPSHRPSAIVHHPLAPIAHPPPMIQQPTSIWSAVLRKRKGLAGSARKSFNLTTILNTPQHKLDPRRMIGLSLSRWPPPYFAYTPRRSAASTSVCCPIARKLCGVRPRMRWQRAPKRGPGTRWRGAIAARRWAGPPDIASARASRWAFGEHPRVGRMGQPCVRSKARGCSQC